MTRIKRFWWDWDMPILCAFAIVIGVSVNAFVPEVHSRQDPKPTELYPLVPIEKLAETSAHKEGTKWVRPRAATIGTVAYVNHEADGDWHVRLESNDMELYVVCEIIPELPLKNGHPKVGQKIRAWGIVRWDGEHKWSELHPLVGWEEAK